MQVLSCVRSYPDDFGGVVAEILFFFREDSVAFVRAPQRNHYQSIMTRVGVLQKAFSHVITDPQRHELDKTVRLQAGAGITPSMVRHEFLSRIFPRLVVASKKIC
jgi:hypothetical protein